MGIKDELLDIQFVITVHFTWKEPDPSVADLRRELEGQVQAYCDLFAANVRRQLADRFGFEDVNQQQQ